MELFGHHSSYMIIGHPYSMIVSSMRFFKRKGHWTIHLPINKKDHYAPPHMYYSIHLSSKIVSSKWRVDRKGQVTLH